MDSSGEKNFFCNFFVSVFFFVCHNVVNLFYFLFIFCIGYCFWTDVFRLYSRCSGLWIGCLEVFLHLIFLNCGFLNRTDRRFFCTVLAFSFYGRIIYFIIFSDVFLSLHFFKSVRLTPFRIYFLFSWWYECGECRPSKNSFWKLLLIFIST